MDLILEIWHFARARKKAWLFPLILLFLLVGALLVFTSTSVVAPFIYTLF